LFYGGRFSLERPHFKAYGDPKTNRFARFGAKNNQKPQKSAVFSIDRAENPPLNLRYAPGISAAIRCFTKSGNTDS